MSDETNDKYERALGEYLEEYKNFMFDPRLSVPFGSLDPDPRVTVAPWLAVLRCVAWGVYYRVLSNWKDTSAFDVSSVTVWSNLDDDNSFQAMALLVDKPYRDHGSVRCGWTPTDSNYNTTDYKQATGGRMILTDETGPMSQVNTTVVRKDDGTWFLDTELFRRAAGNATRRKK
jgi:hypothetical protein